MQIRVSPASADEVLPLRIRYNTETNCQIVHDSIHRREGWTITHRIELDGNIVGFGSIAVSGPWKGKPTIFEFYVLPEYRTRAFALFEAYLKASGGRYFEVQSSDALLTVMLHTYGRKIASEKIVFADKTTTRLPVNGAVLRAMTDQKEVRMCLERRQGGGEWLLEVEGDAVGKGGILFHYNRPYGDIYMEVNKNFRKRGLGSYLVQELKRECYALGAIPCARCSPTNAASRKTLQRAGFIPYAHILNGIVASGYLS